MPPSAAAVPSARSVSQVRQCNIAVPPSSPELGDSLRVAETVHGSGLTCSLFLDAEPRPAAAEGAQPDEPDDDADAQRRLPVQHRVSSQLPHAVGSIPTPLTGDIPHAR